MVMGLIGTILYVIGHPFVALANNLKLAMVGARRWARHRSTRRPQAAQMHLGRWQTWKKTSTNWWRSLTAPNVSALDLSPRSAHEAATKQTEYQWLTGSESRSWRNWWFEVCWGWQMANEHAPWRKVQTLTAWSLPPGSLAWWLSGSGIAVVIMISLAASTSWGSWYFYDRVLANLPSVQRLQDQLPEATTRIYDRDGQLLYKVFAEENRTLVTLDQISPYAIQATIAIEDSQFYEHWGISLRGIMRALVHNVQNETVQGGSTITQQLVKNRLLTTERTWQRKIREAILALIVEARYEKAQILEMYLNEVGYGGAIYGIEEASQWYFGKSARDLSLAESALLAGLPQSPTRYSPFSGDLQRAYARQAEVLDRMATMGLITTEQKTAAQGEKLTFHGGVFDIQSPHFVMFVRELLAQQFGEDMVNTGGLEVHTTLDSRLQASAEAAVNTELKRLGRLNVSNGAALITNPKSGEVLAMVGSRDYFDVANDGQVNITLRERQPGSSIKPLTYAAAFERGLTPRDQIDDSPVVYRAPGAPPYTPKNYDGRFHGRVTLREALGSSYNIPAVRLLAQVGIPTMVNLGRAMGITTWQDPTRFGLALTLGAGEVRMYDMAQVYGTFANGGYTVPLNPIISVRSATGKELYRNPCIAAVSPCNGHKVLSEWTAYQITDVLRDNNARTPAFGPRSALYIPNQEVAVKTGTTNSLRDNWTIGYTQDRVVLTWVGNNDNTPMSAVASGVTGASPIWRHIMTNVLAETRHTFALPVGYQRVAICAATGTLPCAACPRITEEIFPIHRLPTQACRNEQFTPVKPEEAKTASRE